MTQRIVVMRGVPGSGKSHEVRRLSVENELRQVDVLVFSADFFFERSGVYRFDPKLLGRAHSECLRGFTTALTSPPEHRDELLIVDNTNTTLREMNTYVKLAQAYGVSFEIRTILTDPALAAVRNSHGVPVEKVWQMHRRMMDCEIPADWPHVVVPGTVLP